MSKKSWLILYNKLLYKMGEDLLDTQYANKYMVNTHLIQKNWKILPA